MTSSRPKRTSERSRAGPPAPIRVLLADHQPLTLRGLQTVLEEEGIRVVERCTDGEAVLAAIERSRPDVAVIDATLADGDGTAVLRALRERGLASRVVLLAAAMDQKALVDAVRLGVDGIVRKDEATRALVSCVRNVHAGGRWVPDDLYRRIVRVEAAFGGLEGLTPREAEVAVEVAEGRSNKEVAERLGIANGTVRIHLHNIFRKLGIQNRVELANRVREGNGRMEPRA
jgi:DNA-binding NarL/FixJ family response regulator